MQEITWLGHASWKMVTSQGIIIYVDPWITENPVCDISIEEICDADIICVTHGHGDHLGEAIDLVKDSGAILVTIPEVYAYAELHGVPYDKDGGCVHLGGSIVQKGITFHCVNALHTSDIWGYEYGEEKKIYPGSGCCGYVIKAPDNKSVYFAGDTGLFGDMRLIGDILQPEISILPIGGKYTMGPEMASYAAEFLSSEIIIPGHYNTFDGNKQNPDDFTELVREKTPNIKVIPLKQGESFEV